MNYKYIAHIIENRQHAKTDVKLHSVITVYEGPYAEIAMIRAGVLGPFKPMTKQGLLHLRVSANDEAIPKFSGFVPNNLIYINLGLAKDLLVWHIPPGKHRILVSEGKVTSKVLELPGFVMQSEKNKLFSSVLISAGTEYELL